MAYSKVILNGTTLIDLTDDTVEAGKMLSGYKATAKDGVEVIGTISSQAAQTIVPGVSDKTIASGKYLSGTQTIKGDADLVAANIKKDVVLFDGQTGAITGTFTTTPTGKTAMTAASLRSGYAGFINGSQVNGSMADTSVTEGTTTVSGTTATRGTWSQTAGYTAARTVAAATFANEGTSGSSYVDISGTTSAPVLVSGDYLYINKGYTDNLKISLAKLVPDGSDVKGHGEYLLSGHSAYDDDGTLVAGTIPTIAATDLSVSGKTVTVPVGYYTGANGATAVTKSVADGSVTQNAPTIDSSTGIVTATSTVVAGYVDAEAKSNTLQLTVKEAATYNASTSARSIAAGTYLTGKQTIRAVTTSNITAENIKDGVVVKVGDSGSSTRIKNVTGTFTDASTVSSGQTAAATGQILSGYSAWVDGEEVQGSIANGVITNNTSGGTSSGTINRGNQIKIGAGYYPSDIYYQAQENSGTLEIEQAGTFSCDGYENVLVPDDLYTINILDVSNASVTMISGTVDEYQLNLQTS